MSAPLSAGHEPASPPGAAPPGAARPCPRQLRVPPRPSPAPCSTPRPQSAQAPPPTARPAPDAPRPQRAPKALPARRLAQRPGRLGRVRHSCAPGAVHYALSWAGAAKWRQKSRRAEELAPLEANPAVPGPPPPLLGMEDVEARFAHLLQPIRDLTKNWEVDVAAQLGEYLEEVSAAGGGAGRACSDAAGGVCVVGVGEVRVRRRTPPFLKSAFHGSRPAVLPSCEGSRSAELSAPCPLSPSALRCSRP